MQNRFKRLISPHDLRNSSRFESLLMTSRRSPVIVGHGAASRLKSVNFSGSLSSEGSFFNRQYSTSTFLKTAHNQTLVSGRIAAVRRLVSDSITPVSDAAVVSARYSLKARAYARGRSNYALEHHELGAGSLDPRLSRAKSPRNLQFLQRILKESTTALTFKRKLFKDNLYNCLLPVTELPEQSAHYRGARAARSQTLTSHLVATRHSALLKFRKEVINRRTSSLLKSRSVTLRETLLPFVEKRIFTKKNKARARYRKTLKATALPSKKTKDSGEIVMSSRSILNYRKAQHRTQHLFYSKPLALARRSIVLKRPVKSFLVGRNLKAKFARNI